jgi:hypothetical protein
VDEVDRVGEARKVRERPVEGVLGVGPEVDGDEDVPAAAALPGLALELWRRVGNHGDQVRHHHLPVRMCNQSMCVCTKPLRLSREQGHVRQFVESVVTTSGHQAP